MKIRGPLMTAAVVAMSVGLIASPASATHLTSVSVTPANVSVTQGGTASYTGSVNNSSNSAPCNLGWTLSLSGAPTGSTGTFTPASAPFGTSQGAHAYTLDVNVPADAAPGMYTLRVRATWVFDPQCPQGLFDGSWREAVTNLTVIAPVVSAQTIAFGALSSRWLGDAPFGVSATATSGLPVSFGSDTPGVCTVAGSTVTMVAGGLCSVRASQPGNGSYSAAPDVVQSFVVHVYTGGPLGDCKGPPLTAPTNVSSAPGNASATVSWFPTQQTPPYGCVAGYIVTPSLGGVAQPPVLIPGGGTTTVIKGLTNGGVYTFTVASEDGTVIGPQSTASVSITIGAPAAASAIRAAHLTRGAIRVAFSAPNNNGAPITGYRAACKSTNGGVTRARTGTRSPITVAGLTPGKTYRCNVTATNGRGTGPLSRASATARA